MTSPETKSSSSSIAGDPPPSTGSVQLIDLSKPRYDQSTYTGRAKHFFETANPLNVFVTRQRLEKAAKLIKDYK